MGCCISSDIMDTSTNDYLVKNTTYNGLIYSWKYIKQYNNLSSIVILKDNNNIEYIGKIFRTHDTDLLHNEIMVDSKINKNNEYQKYLITIYDTISINKINILVYKKYEIDLHDYIISLIKNNNVIDTQLIKTIAYNIASGINILHTLHISHNDLKMENVLLDTLTYETKIIDFSYASAFNNIPYYNGTYCYIAPERLNEAYSIIPSKSDVWSLGILYYIIFILKYPINMNTTRYNTAVYKKIILNVYKIQDALLKDLLIHMLSINPQNRYTINDVINHEFFKSIHNASMNNISSSIISI